MILSRRTFNNLLFVLGATVLMFITGCGGGETTPTSSDTQDTTVTTSSGAPSESGTQPADTSTQSPASTAVEATISASPTSGAASLTVNLSTAGNTSHTYRWNFGDNSTDSGQSVTHIYNTPGTYTVTLTASSSAGVTATSTRNIYVFGSSVDNSQAIVPQGVYFFDDFNYSVQRSGDTTDIFRNHGWSGGKAENLTGGSGKGYIYTTNTIPGYSGPLPGKNSSHVLAIEGRPSTFGIQTDFYLQFGGDFDNQVPADVWFQYWVYTNDYDDPTNQNDQMSRFGPHPKFIYPTKGGYPSNNGLWILYSDKNSKAPFSNDLGENSSEYYMYLQDYEDIRYTTSNGVIDKIGQTDLSDHIVPNRWTLVKIHIDTSTVNPRYEQWMKPMGGQWLKVAEYIQGQTPNLEWHIAPENIGGHRTFRMPSTLNECRFNTNPDLKCDSWMYLDDFTIATSEDTLPVYPY